MPWRPGPASIVLCATPEPYAYGEDIVQGMATLAGLPGVSVVSASYGCSLEFARPDGASSNSGTARSCSRPSPRTPT